MKVYKYRANLTVDGKKRDTTQLSEKIFYASTMSQLNDPFEGSVEISKRPEDDRWATPLIQSISQVGIYSLAKLKKDETFPCNELLWAHYANSHKGFCIEYHLEKLQSNLSKDFDIRNTINVKYTNDRPSIKETDDIFNVQKKVFGTKSLAWEYENEIRLVFYSSGLKPIADESITAIYFGLNISKEDRQTIIDSLRSDNIDFYQMERVEDLYKLKATKLEFKFDYAIVSKRCASPFDSIMILYLSPNKDKNSILNFISHFRKGLKKQAHLTIIDDIRIAPFFDYPNPRVSLPPEQELLYRKHWIAYAPAFNPSDVLMYPEDC